MMPRLGASGTLDCNAEQRLGDCGVQEWFQQMRDRAWTARGVPQPQVTSAPNAATPRQSCEARLCARFQPVRRKLHFVVEPRRTNDLGVAIRGSSPRQRDGTLVQCLVAEAHAQAVHWMARRSVSQRCATFASRPCSPPSMPAGQTIERCVPSAPAPDVGARRDVQEVGSQHALP